MKNTEVIKFLSGLCLIISLLASFIYGLFNANVNEVKFMLVCIVVVIGSIIILTYIGTLENKSKIDNKENNNKGEN